MTAEEAVTEFANMLRIGSAALREIMSKDAAFANELEDDVNQLTHLIDRIGDVGESMRSKTQSLRRGTSA